MMLIVVFVLFLGISSHSMSQEIQPTEEVQKQDEKQSATETKEEKEPSIETKNAEQMEVTPKNEQNEKLEQMDEMSPGLNGFAEINWGSSYRDVQERFRTLSNNQSVDDPINVLSNVIGESLLISKGGVQYKFLFYVKKKPPMEDNLNILNQKDNESEEMEMKNLARFFFVSTNLPFVPSEKLYKKIESKYGKHTISRGDKTRGAYIWDINNGVIVQWVESYTNKAYSRSVYYISKEIREEVIQDLETYQNYKELKAVEKLIP